MEIKREHIVTIVIILLIIWVYLTWGYEGNERFEPIQQWPYLPPKYWNEPTPKEWAPWWYYNFEDQKAFYPAVPAISNYDPSDYKLPPESLEKLRDGYQKKMQMQKIKSASMPEMKDKTPVPQNVPALNTMHPVGAPVHEALKEQPSILRQSPHQEMPIHDLQMDMMRDMPLEMEHAMDPLTCTQTRFETMDPIVDLEAKPQMPMESKPEMMPEAPRMMVNPQMPPMAPVPETIVYRVKSPSNNYVIFSVVIIILIVIFFMYKS